MKTKIEVANKKEAALIRLGLDDATVRAFVMVMGALSRIPTERGKHRVMRFVRDHFEENNETK